MGKTNTNWNIVKQFKHEAEKINHKEHFRLKKNDVTVEQIAKVRYGSHCMFNVNYHLVWVSKTRMKILVEPFKSMLKKWMTKICKEKKWYQLALEIMPDHLHYFLSAHPKWAPMRIVQYLKQTTSKKLRKEFSIIRQTRDTNDFWATGYYCGTAGHVSAKQVARYITEQTKKLKDNWHLYDIKPFEYDISEVTYKNKNQTTLDAYA